MVGGLPPAETTPVSDVACRWFSTNAAFNGVLGTDIIVGEKVSRRPLHRNEAIVREEADEKRDETAIHGKVLVFRCNCMEFARPICIRGELWQYSF